ncbi:MAG: DUF1684 domain-containing protein [Thermoplasmata archaeon]
MADYGTELAKEREMKDRFMSGHPESPFLVGEIVGFNGLQYFPIDPEYRADGVLERSDAPREVFLRTNRDGQLTCRNVGTMRFKIHGEEHGLQVFHAGEQVGPSVFVPFRDLTCGAESYDSGRYLVFQLTEDDHYVVDFNMAFNPYCAYTDRFECGLPPPENDLPIPIRAGEKAWSAQALRTLAVPRADGAKHPGTRSAVSPPGKRHPRPRTKAVAPAAAVGRKPRRAPARKPARTKPAGRRRR